MYVGGYLWKLHNIDGCKLEKRVVKSNVQNYYYYFYFITMNAMNL